MQNVIIDYFSELFACTKTADPLSDREQLQCVTAEKNMMLIQPISKGEVKAAVFSMHAEKAPGYDGLNPSIYQAYWSIVQDDVVNFCRKFFNTRVIDEDINRTVICLIPKVKQP